MNLMKELPRIAARVLGNTRTVHPDMKFKFELIAEAYGTAAICDDFAEWCRELVSTEQIHDRPKYPVSEYLKIIDSRLGFAPVETHVDIKDPTVAAIVSLAYELTNILPSATAVAKVLADYPVQEVTEALKEFTEGLTERDVRGGMRSFWAEGGAGAIILARRRRASGAGK